MFLHKIIFPFLLLLTVTSCVKYRDVACKDCNFVAPPSGVIEFGALRINEYICKGADPGATTLLGSDAKWFEIYNPTNDTIVLTAGQWYVTDTLGTPNKYAIPANTPQAQAIVPAKGYQVIMCLKSGADPSPSHINASFSLSSTVGSIGIYYQATPSSSIVAIDTLNYNFGSGANSGTSYGCSPDGIRSSPMNPLTAVTPLASNH